MEKNKKFTPQNIGSLKDFIEAINDCCLKYKSAISETTRKKSLKDIWFRGEPMKYKYMLPSLFRGQDNNEISPITDELGLINNAIQYNPALFENCHTQLERLVKMQHYGLPTRLLDVTKSPFVALYMACEQEKGTNDGRVLFVDNSRIEWADEDLLEDFVSLIGVSEEKDNDYVYRYKISFGKAIKYLENKHSGKMPEERILDIFSKATDSLLFLPKYNNDRIKLQQGAMIFSALYSVNETQISEYERLKCVDSNIPLPKQKFTKKELNQIVFCNKPRSLNDIFSDIVFTIDKNDKEKILDELNNYGVNEATVYPEPEHQMRYVARCCKNPNIKPIKK